MEQDKPSIVPGTNPIMVVWIIIAVFSTFGIAAMEDIGPVLAMVAAVFILISIVGMILSATIPGKIGPVLFIVGCAFFVPLGLIGAIGGRKALEKYQRGLLAADGDADDPGQNKWDRL